MNEKLSRSSSRSREKEETGTTNRVRFSQFQKVCAKALDEATKVLSEENIQSCFPTLTNPGLISSIRAQLVTTWKNNATREFQAIYDERDLEAKLDLLDKLISDAKLRMQSGSGWQVPIDELTPRDIISSHLIPLKLQKLQQLKDQLTALQHENTQLSTELLALTKDCTAIHDEINSKINIIQQFNNQSHEIDINKNLKLLIDTIANEEVAGL